MRIRKEIQKTQGSSRTTISQLLTMAAKKDTGLG
jgi:hypothetical protein